MDSRLQNYVALATVLIKAKSRGTLIQDYIAALRSAVEGSQPSSSHILDGISLWRTLFDGAQRRILDVETKLLILDLTRGSEAVGFIARDGEQRKREVGTSTEKALNKRSKHQNYYLFRTDEILTLNGSVSESRDRELVLRVMYSLARQAHGSPPTLDGLTHLIRLACEAIINTLENAYHSNLGCRISTRGTSNLNESCTATKNVWSLIIAQLQSSSALRFSSVRNYMLIPQICTIVQRLLCHLHQQCFDQAIADLGMFKNVMAHKFCEKQTSFGRDMETEKHFSHNCDCITSTLEHMMSKLSGICVQYLQIFNAIATICLEYLGSALSYYMFANSLSKERGNDGVSPPRGLKYMRPLNPEHAARTMELESPYLIRVLKAVMSKQSQMEMHIAANDCTENLKTDTLRNLQSSLLKGIFQDEFPVGVCEGNDNATSFTAEGSHDMSLGNRDELQNWFLGQVWEIIGWDILFDDDFEGIISKT